MITLGYLLKQYIDNTRDDSGENTQRGIDKINAIQKMLCSSHNYHWLETFKQVATVLSTNTFPLPKDYRKMITVSQTYGTGEYPIEEQSDPKKFNELFYSSGVAAAFGIQRYHLRGNNLLIFPACSTSTDYIKMWYLKNPISMTQVDYSEGLVSVALAGTTVTGTGTFWSANVIVGAHIIIDDISYKITTVTSDTELVIDTPFQGATLTSYSYLIGDIPTIPEPFTDILWVGAAREYWALYKKDEKQAGLLAEIFNGYEDRMKENTNAKSVEDVMLPRKANV